MVGPSLVVRIIRVIVFWGLFWGPPVLGNYNFCLEAKSAGLSDRTAALAKKFYTIFDNKVCLWVALYRPHSEVCRVSGESEPST